MPIITTTVAPPDSTSEPVDIKATPPTPLSIQSQFAHLQLKQSMVNKEKAEELMLQVQDSHNNQRKSAMYIALMEKAKRDHTTDVAKELEEFCKKNNIPFNKSEVKVGEMSSKAWWLSLLGVAITVGVAAAGIALLGGLPAFAVVLALAPKILNVASSLLGVLIAAPFLPQELKDVASKILGIVDALKLILSLIGVKQSPQSSPQQKAEAAAEAKAQLKTLIDSCIHDPDLTGDKIGRLWQEGVKHGVLTMENARKVAADQGFDLDSTLKELGDALSTLKSENDALPTADRVEGMKEGLARLLFIFAYPFLGLFEGKSFETAFKEYYKQTGGRFVCDDATWLANIRQMEAFQASEGGKVQSLMVLINHHIGQYNSFLQGAMTALSQANQVMTALNKGT